MKKLITLLLVAIFCLSPLSLAKRVNAASDGVKIGMSFDGIATVGGEMTLRITVKKPSVALAGLEFALDFPSEFVTPTITVNDENGSEMANLITKMPQGWEQLCSYSASENRYYFRFAMPENGASLTNEDEIVIDLPFKVKAAGVIGFNIPNSEIIAISANDSLTALSGKGGEFSVVAAGDTEKFAIDLESNGAANENGLYYLNVTVTNVGDGEGIIGLEFELEYDPKYFKPYLTKNDSNQMDSFIKSSPSNSWEQMCTLYESDNKYVLRFAALHAESVEDCEAIAIGKGLKLSIPFMVVGREGEYGEFLCDTATAFGVNNKSQKIKGVGAIKTVSIGERSSSIPEWIYKTASGYIFAPDNTSISDFLQPLSNGYYITLGGERIESGIVKTEYTLTNGSDIFTVVVKGDVNCNGIIDSMDYVYTKRVYYGTYKVEDARFYATAVTNGESVTSMDYVYIKRHYFGTYNLNR